MMYRREHYGRISASTGWLDAYRAPETGNARLNTQALASSAYVSTTGIPGGQFGYVLEMPVRKAPFERVSSIIVQPRSTSSHWQINLHLFGAYESPTVAANWFGPIDRQSSSSTLWGLTCKRMKIGTAGAARVASTWFLGQACQFDTQDFRYVGILPQITSTETGGDKSWSSLSGIQLDVECQEATAS